MNGFTRERLTVAGVATTVLRAGQGEPLVYFHGAGTFTGFDFALPWARRFEVIIPQHPGFGESAVDERIDSLHDYVLHYLDLFDAMGLRRFRLAGHSLGGWLAATFAIEHAHRLERLALLSPVGLRVPEHPTVDIFKLPPGALPGYLVANPQVLARLQAQVPDVEALVQQYREITSLARVAWTRLYDLKLPRWLHRVRVPTLLLWGSADRLLPVEQAEVWASLLPQAERRVLEGCGHGLPIESSEAVEVIADFMTG